MAAEDSGRILVVGEALVDIVSGPDGDMTETRPGGAPLNVAVGLARLQVPTTLLTSFGADDHGALVARHLAESGVRLASPSPGPAPTSVAHASLDERGAATYHFDLAWDPPAVPVPDNVQALHTGSLATVLEPGAKATRALVDSAIAAGATITYDPNVRPAISPDRGEAWRRVRQWAERAHVVKLSDADAGFLCPGTGIGEVIDRFLAWQRTRLVVVTCGADGATLATARERVHVEAPRVRVVDTVGAGDSFMSALLADMAGRELADPDSLAGTTRQRLQQIGAFAVTAAAITCSRRGADPPYRREVTPADP
jgi:fructokinase